MSSEMPNEKMGKKTRYDFLPAPLKVYYNVLTVIGIAIVVYYMFNFRIGGVLLVNVQYHFLLFGLFGSTVFLMLPDGSKTRWYDYVLSAVHFALSLWFAFHGNEIATIGWRPASPFNLVLGLIYLFILLEGGRRGSYSNTFPAICLIAGLYPLISGHLPGILMGSPMKFTGMISEYCFGQEGIQGVPAQVMGGVIVGFLIFAGLLAATGAGSFFINLANALLGKYRGGPAKVAVVGSALFGTLSGSITANVVGTGSFTIPAMIRMGYPAYYAGAVESVASTGGSIMPPVMGIAAFVMASLLGIPYGEVIVAAALPAVLYYWGLLIQADAYAAKVGMKAMPVEEIPKLWAVLKRGWPFLFVCGFLVWGLVIMRWEVKTPFYAVLLAIVLSYTSRETMLTPKRMAAVILEIGRFLTMTMSVVLPVGILIGSIMATGIGGSFTSAIVQFGGDNIYLALLLGVVACYIMGMAGISLAAYIILSVTLAPTVIQVGHLNPKAVHLFIIYFSVMAYFTPPIAGACFVAAGIAKANPLKIGLQAIKLGAVLYFIPFTFVFDTALIFEGPIFWTIAVFIRCLIGILFLSYGLEGYLIKVGILRFFERVSLVAGGFMLALPFSKFNYIGTVLLVASMVIILLYKKRSEKAVKVKFETLS